MIEDMDFPSSGIERRTILLGAAKECDYSKLTFDEKVIFVQGMNKGYWQGRRHQAQQSIDAFTQAIVGFKP